MPYSITSIGHGADPGLLAVSSQVTLVKPIGRRPLLSTRPTVNFPAKEIRSPLLADTKLCCLVTETQVCLYMLTCTYLLFKIGKSHHHVELFLARLHHCRRVNWYLSVVSGRPHAIASPVVWEGGMWVAKSKGCSHAHAVTAVPSQLDIGIDVSNWWVCMNCCR